jgi:hypothetical protein
VLLNINGLSTRRVNKLTCKELIEVFDTHDIVLLTETWTNDYSDLHVQGFEHFVLNRTEMLKTSKRASGGIIAYIRNYLVTPDTLVFRSHDDILCIKISASKLCLENDLYIILCYAVPEGSSRQALIESNMFDRLLSYILELEIKQGLNLNLLVCGDLNAHTSELPDFVPDDDIAHSYFLPDDYVEDSYLPRKSLDKGRVNSNGIQLLDICKQSGMRILNGRLYDDKIGNFTYVGKTGKV